MDEKISIIVAVYNIEVYIERCINSLINQSYKKIEILLIDDGSTDGSGEICRKYSKANENIKYYYKKNGGLSDARNYGISVASGEFISFVDGDDFVHPEMYRTIYEGMKKGEVQIGVCSFQTFYKESELCWELSNWGIGSVYSSDNILKKLFTNSRTDFVTSCGKIYHRRLFDDISFPRGRYREDEFTTYKLWFKADKVYYTPKKLYFYYQRSTSILHQPNAKKETDYYDALLERHDYFNRKKVSKDILQLDTDFCVTQLYNVLFLDDSVPDSRKRYYISQYKLLYDQSKIKMKLNRFFFMRFMPRLFERAWKIKKGRLIAGKW